MAYKEQDVVLTTKDASGNTVIQMPITRAANVEELSNTCLPLSGGTMMNHIDFDSVIALARNVNNSYLQINGGQDWSSGASLELFGKDSDDGAIFKLNTLIDGVPFTLASTASGELLWKDISVLNPVGTVIAMAANSAPAGYLLCNGAEVSRTTYANLFAKIGTTYGGGNGSSTFNLPNLTDKFIQGSGTAGTVKSAGLPNLNGDFNYLSMNNNNEGNTAPFTIRANHAVYTYGGGSMASPIFANSMDFNASNDNAIYGSSDTVQPPALTMRMYIKY